MSKDAKGEGLSAEELKSAVRQSFSDLREIFGFETEEPPSYSSIYLKNGILIARYPELGQVNVDVYSKYAGSLHFCRTISDLKSVGSRNPSFTFKGKEIKLSPLSIKPEPGFSTIKWDKNQGEVLSLLAIELVDWLKESVEEGELKPLDLSIKFPSNPTNL